jgi:branched-chain amino acid aminotransferase
MNPPAAYINHNGNILPAGQALLTADNRGFRYGEGLFETMLVKGRNIRLGAYHFQRLQFGMRLLRLGLPPFLTPEKLEEQILELAEINHPNGPCRARLIVFQGDGGLSDPTDPIAHYIIQAGSLPAGSEGWNEKGQVIDVFPDGRKSCDPLAGLKSNNYLLYVLAGQYAREQRLTDCLVLNSQDRLADSTIANLFYIRDGKFFTPPLSEGGVAGVMRRYLLESLPRAGYTVSEEVVRIGDLEDADEVFLTNALKGINWVSSFRSARFTHRLAAIVYQQLIEGL